MFILSPKENSSSAISRIEPALLLLSSQLPYMKGSSFIIVSRTGQCCLCMLYGTKEFLFIKSNVSCTHPGIQFALDMYNCCMYSVLFEDFIWSTCYLTFNFKMFWIFLKVGTQIFNLCCLHIGSACTLFTWLYLIDMPQKYFLLRSWVLLSRRLNSWVIAGLFYFWHCLTTSKSGCVIWGA